mmetsp:Transcript_28651/g.95082  ORF Transcript_28651/g.95082 Transcript_28651/m.95082 type:complete len:290 (+) Transcript_28651:138-1007(+)
MTTSAASAPAAIAVADERPTGYTAWVTEVAPRLGIAGSVIGLILVNSTMPQVVSTSDGRMPKLSPKVWARMAFQITPKAGGLKFAQYGVMREMKLSMDNYLPSGASTMLAFGVVGTFFQSIIYNTLIADMYKIHMGVEKTMSVQQLAKGLRPGFIWCFGRECFSMGGGMWLGPTVKATLQGEFDRRGIAVPDYPLRFGSGFLSGACTALATQWLHNTTLYAGRMAAVEEPVGAPFYTMSSLRVAWKEMGPRMFYANYPQRMCLIAGAVGLMNMVDIFHRPDLIFVRGCK